MLSTAYEKMRRDACKKKDFGIGEVPETRSDQASAIIARPDRIRFEPIADHSGEVACAACRGLMCLDFELKNRVGSCVVGIGESRPLSMVMGSDRVEFSGNPSDELETLLDAVFTWFGERYGYRPNIESAWIQ